MNKKDSFDKIFQLFMSIAFVLILVLTFVGVNQISKANNTVEMPNIVGKTVFDAQDRLKLEGFDKITVFPQEAENYWTICEQEPQYTYPKDGVDSTENMINKDTHILLSASKSCATS